MDVKRASVQTHAAALYQALIEADMLEEATEFQEWFLEVFDLDLED